MSDGILGHSYPPPPAIPEHAQQKRIVPGAGPLDCCIAFVGEAPGQEEDRTGQPFVGSSGLKLNKMLSKLGIVRESVYVTNVVKERPSNNIISPFISFTRKGVVTSKLYNEYEEQLYDELRHTKANVIVPLGNVPLWALARKTGITNQRGSILHSVSALGDRKVIPTIHPSAALRNMEYTYFIQRDLEKVVYQSKFPDFRLPQRTYRTSPSFTDAIEYLRNIPSLTAFDIEVSGYQLSCLSFSHSPTDSMCIPFRGRMGNYWQEEEEIVVMREIGNVLTNPKIKKIIHNSAFDCFFMYEQYGIRVQNYEDTMIASYMLYTDFPKSLAFCTSFWTDEPFYKDEKEESPDSKVHLSPDLNRFYIYNCKDSCVPHEFWPLLEQRFDKYGVRQAYQNQKDVVDSIIYKQTRGVLLDVDRARLHKNLITKEIEELDKEIMSLCLPNIEKAPDEALVAYMKDGPAKTKLKDRNKKLGRMRTGLITSPNKRKAYFYAVLKQSPYRTKEGVVTTDGKALLKLAAKGIKEAKLMFEVVKKRKMLQSYLDISLDKDNRLRSSINPVGTSSGRFSAEQLWRGSYWSETRHVGLNIQTLPEGFKPYVKADPDCILINLDLAQAENRIVAWVGNVHRMKAAFIAKQDVHKMTAALIFKTPYDLVSDEPNSCPLAGGTKSYRYWGKQCNHALNYGLAAKAFAMNLEIQVSVAKMLQDSYFSAYPEVRSIYQQNIISSLQQNRTLKTPYGRVRWFCGFMNDEMYREGFSFIPQETVARKMNTGGLIPLTKERDRFSSIEPLIQCHDSLLLQAHLSAGPAKIASQLLDLKKQLEEPIPWVEPFVIPVDFKIGLNYGSVIKNKETGERKNKRGLRSLILEDFETELDKLLKEEDDLQSGTVSEEMVDSDDGASDEGDED